MSKWKWPIDMPPTPPAEEDSPADIDYDALVIEHNQPLGSIFLEKQSRLLTCPLYASWPGPGEERPFFVVGNVGWFYQTTKPAVVCDCLVNLDVTCPENLHIKEGRYYYHWDAGKAPDVVVEVVSDQIGGEESSKKALYARLGVSRYAIFDPKQLLSSQPLKVYGRVCVDYEQTDHGPWSWIGLGLRLWQGTFEGHDDLWLRWCDANAQLILTGEERAHQERERADQEAKRADRAAERIRLLEEELRRLKGEGPALEPPLKQAHERPEP